MQARNTLALAGLATAVLAACGGGSDDVAAPPPPAVATAVPDSAVASSTALVGYLKSLKADDESAEALTLPSVNVSASDTEEPQAL